MTGRPLLDVSSDVLQTDAFRAGLRAGIVGAVVVGGLGLVARSRRATPLPIVALAAVAASMVGLRNAFGLPGDARTGLLLLAAAGVAGVVARRPVAIGAIVSVPGAVLLARAAPSEPSWAPTFITITAITGGSAIAAFDRDDAPCIGPALLAVSVAALWVAVPDTELPLVLLGAVPLFALAGWPFRLARVGAAGAFALAGLLAWVATVGGAARPPSVIAGFGALGLFVVAPVVGVVTRSARGTVTRAPVLALVVLHAGCVAFTARVAGTRSSISMACVVAAGGFVLTALAFVALAVAFPADDPERSSATVPLHGGHT